MLVIGHREYEAGDPHISTLQLAIEPIVALSREVTAARITIIRGLASNPLETSCLWRPAAMNISPACTYYTAAGNGGLPVAALMYMHRY